ncbi:MAG: hypothetical protein AAGL09_18070, partial [Pseudomonadota bacterium]
MPDRKTSFDVAEMLVNAGSALGDDASTASANRPPQPIPLYYQRVCSLTTTSSRHGWRLASKVSVVAG